MRRVVPWVDLAAVIEPVYPTADGLGHLPVGVESMLRLYCLQQWLNLSDPAGEGRCMTRALCGSLWAFISVESPCPTRRRFARFGIC